MRLYVMRHGVAVGPSEVSTEPDSARALTPKGIMKTRAAARGLRVLSVRPDVMFTSPYLRAAQTAEIVAEVLGFPPHKIRTTEALTPAKDPAEIWKELSRLRAKDVMCFGHAPHLDYMIGRALGARTLVTALKKAGVVCLEMERLNPPRGGIVWLCAPRILRLLGE